MNDRSLRWIAIALLGMAIVFRFAHLDRKLYWHDEVYTSLRVSGYIGEEVTQQLFTGEFLGVEELQRYQRLSPELGIDATVKSLSTHPEHPPLYYLLVRWWMERWGSSVAVVRSLSALISLLVFPLVYGVCQELFGLPRVGWVAIALFSVSPFHILYAQEARQYSLWTVTILLSSWTLLRAMGQKTPRQTSGKAPNQLVSFPKRFWYIYALAVTLNLYTNLLSVLVILGEGLWVLIQEKFRGTASLKAYILAVSLAGFSFTPWLDVLISNWQDFEQKTSWTKQINPELSLVKLWGLHLSCPFIDFQIPNLDHPYVFMVPPLVVSLLIPAYFYLIKHTPSRVWLFIFSLGLTAIFLIIPDLIWGGVRSASSRYLIPVYLGTQLAVAYFIAGFWAAKERWKNQVSQFIFAILIIVGIISCTQSMQSQVWWNKGWSSANLGAITAINQVLSPLVIAYPDNTTLGDLISMSYLVKRETRFWLIPQTEVKSVIAQVEYLQKNYSIFFFKISSEIQGEISSKYPLELIPETELFQVCIDCLKPIVSSRSFPSYLLTEYRGQEQ